MSPSRITILLSASLALCLHDLALADPPYHNCSSSTATPNGPFQVNLLNNLLPSLSSKANASNFYSTSAGSGANISYGLFMCLHHVAPQDCDLCVRAAARDIQLRCPNTTEAIVWEENCQLRYSDTNFFAHLDVSGQQCYFNKMNVSEPGKFTSVVNKTLTNLTKAAAYDPSQKMYATGEVKMSMKDGDTLYAMVQCTRDLSPDDCNTCLLDSIKDVLACSNFSIGARLLSRSCYLRYELYDFFRGETGPPPPIKKRATSKLMVIILVIVAACLAAAFLGSCIYCIGKEKSCIITRGPHFCDIDNEDQNAPGSPFMDMASIYAATNKFSESNKLGEGGFGPVYKGKLSNGKEVAVKRLSRCSEQGSEEFRNEVLLIMKLQHKNLVKLLGFCVHGEEKLLVYEYMPNNSLDVILFDSHKRAQLNWTRRLNIVTGIARGTLYLHEDSRLRIIHRDLKASNILLDCDMNPKISDFGMARIFAGSEGQSNTSRIVGTYGYMAPEYAMEGLYSTKSDIFSFGVLLIEIITGKRNAGFHRTRLAPSLVAYAWHLWNEGRETELIDPLLKGLCSGDEFSRLIHIGLLCVQEDAFYRPTMSSVVVMLKGETVTLDRPSRPAFSVGRFTDKEEGDANGNSVNNLTISSISPR